MQSQCIKQSDLCPDSARLMGAGLYQLGESSTAGPGPLKSTLTYLKHKSTMKYFNEMVVMTGVLILMGTTPVAGCEQGSPVSGMYYVNGSDIDFRQGPSDNHARIINRKTTRALGQTINRTLWPSMVLEGHCETAEWLQVQIVKSDGRPVNWEIGWVHKRFIASAPSVDMQAGLLWDIDSDNEFTVAEKQILRRGALKVLEDEANCVEIVTGYRSGSRQGAYYVTCNTRNGRDPFNVWFTAAEVESDGSLAAPEAYPEILSRRACERAITVQVFDPSKLAFHRYATEAPKHGKRTVIQDFSVKNSSGPNFKYQARCLIQSDGRWRSQ